MLELQADDQIAIVPETVEGGFSEEQKLQGTVPAKNESKSSRDQDVDGLFQHIQVSKDASGSSIALAPAMSLREIGRPVNTRNAQHFSDEIDSSTEYSLDELGRGFLATLIRSVMSWVLPPAPTIRVTLIEEVDGTKKATLWMFQTSHKCWNGALQGHRGRKLVDRVERFDDSLVMLEKGKRWARLSKPEVANDGDHLRVIYIKPLVVSP
eukprot:gene11369-13221_t